MDQQPRGMDHLRELMAQYADGLTAKMEAASAAGAAMVANAQAAEQTGLAEVVDQLRADETAILLDGARSAAEVMRRYPQA